MQNPQTPWNRPAFTRTTFREAPGYSVRTNRWRYVEWGENRGNKGSELYDQQEDPLEMNNLAKDPKHRAVALRLSNLIEQNWK